MQYKEHADLQKFEVKYFIWKYTSFREFYY